MNEKEERVRKGCSGKERKKLIYELSNEEKRCMNEWKRKWERNGKERKKLINELSKEGKKKKFYQKKESKDDT